MVHERQLSNLYTVRIPSYLVSGMTQRDGMGREVGRGFRIGIKLKKKKCFLKDMKAKRRHEPEEEEEKKR